MKNNFKFGLKIVSQDWYWKYNLSYDSAIEKLESMGVDFIIARNSYIPPQNTAVQTTIPKELEYKLVEYDDKEFRRKIKNAGIEYFGIVTFGFDEKAMRKHQNMPVDQNGEKSEKIDWYIGTCPTCDEYNEERYMLVENAMSNLVLDGFFVGFMRYPGFWETWLPGTDGEHWNEYCFCQRCIEKFEQYSGIKVPNAGELLSGQWIRKNIRDQWTQFKCEVIHNIVKNFKNAIKKYNPDAKLMLNTIPFESSNYENYGKSIFGQDPKMLSDVVDVFEVMGYHQMLGQPYQWIKEAGEYIKRLTGKTVVCTVQGKPFYAEGILKSDKRSNTLSHKEFKDSLYSLLDSEVDGAVVFTWSDFLRAEYEENDKDLVNIVTEFNKSHH